MDERVKVFAALSTEELFEIYRLRTAVFVVEQQCAYQEVDYADKTAVHIWLEEEGRIQAYCRLLPPEKEGGEALIGRVIAAKRRGGLGSRVLNLALSTARHRLRAGCVRVEAQSYAREFYEKQGFSVVSAEYLEDGIPHMTMKMRLEAQET